MSVSACARYIGEHYGFCVRPKTLSAMFYARLLPDDLAPVSCGRREIPEAAIPQVVEALRRHGKLGRGAAT